MSNFTIDKNAKLIVETLKNAGYNAFVVGGCVRDMVMGLPPKDFDIATSAKPFEVKELFNKCIDTGIEHGTVTVVINKEMYEVTTFRIDGEYLDNRKPESVLYTDDVREDMLRRDFTMNAIGYNEIDGFIDYFDGLTDIKNKIIRGVGEPAVRFNEDALRMLRAIRFSSTLGFEIEKNTYDAIIEKRELLKNISVERIREEFTKTLFAEYNERISLLIETELIKYYDEDFFNYIKDNLAKIIELIKISKKDRTYLYVALLFNQNKETAKKTLTNLKWDNKTIKDVSEIVGELKTEIIETDYFIRKFVSKHGIENTKIFLYFREILDTRDYSNLKEFLNDIVENNYPTIIKELDIDGNDLKEIGIVNGKQIGETLSYLLDEVLKDPTLNNKSILLKMAGDKNAC